MGSLLVVEVHELLDRVEVLELLLKCSVKPFYLAVCLGVADAGKDVLYS